jgi:hypothetical protein
MKFRHHFAGEWTLGSGEDQNGEGTKTQRDSASPCGRAPPIRSRSGETVTHRPEEKSACFEPVFAQNGSLSPDLPRYISLRIRACVFILLF